MSETYIGNELQIFEHARNWKGYYGSFIRPMLGKKVAEIGAGLGGTTTALFDNHQHEWLCVEPDPALLRQIDLKIQEGSLGVNCTTFCGFSKELKEKFDSILYIDVIEHIEDDSAELKIASNLLQEEGRLFIIVPAHPALYSPFDKMIGHYRRYTKQMLRDVLPEDLIIEKLYYLDSVGYFASLVNKLFLKQSMPTLSQVKCWDKFMVPVSVMLDRLLGFHFGKSVMLIARKKRNENRIA
jgi:SAM-dependent methyltransferase